MTTLPATGYRRRERFFFTAPPARWIEFPMQHTAPATHGSQPFTSRSRVPSRCAAIALCAMLAGAVTADAQVGHDTLGDPLPAGALARLGTQRLRLVHDAMDVAFTLDGKRLCGVDIMGAVREWDASTGKLLREFSAGAAPVSGFSFSADFTRVAISREGGGAQVLDASSGALVLDLEPHGQSAIFSPDGRFLAAWGQPFSKVDLLDARDGAQKLELNETVDKFAGAAFTPDGSLLAMVGLRKITVRSSDSLLVLRDTSSGATLHTMELPDTQLSDLACSPDGSRIVGGDTHGHLRLWDIPSGELRKQLDGIDVIERSLCWSPDGRLIASTVPDSPRPDKGTGLDVFTLRDGETLASRREIAGHHAAISALAFSPDGHRIASACRDHLVRLWDVASGARVLPTPGHETGVQGVAASTDGATILTAGADGRVGVWNGRTWALERTMSAHTATVLSVACSPDGKLGASRSVDGAVLVWATGSAEERSGWVGDSLHAARALAFSPDGRLLASAEEDGKVRVRDVSAAIGAADDLEAEAVMAMARPVHELDAGGAIAFSVAWSPDGKWLATGSSRLRVFDATTGELAHDIKGTSPIASIAFSPDGALIATANADRSVRLYEAATGEARGVRTGHSSRVQAVVFSRDGAMLASSGDNESVIQLWDVAKLAPAGQLAGHDDTVRGLAVLGSGSLVSASADGTCLVWPFPGAAFAPAPAPAK